MDNKPLALVVEDDKNLAFAFSEALDDAGYQVHVVHDGQAALDWLAAETPATIVLDLHIPFVKGAEVLNLIRSIERLKNSRVIIATADDLEASRLSETVSLVLLKPIGFQQLRDLSARLRPRA